LPDSYSAHQGLPRESVALPPGPVRALAGVARHEAAIRAYKNSLVEQLKTEVRLRAAAAVRSAQRVVNFLRFGGHLDSPAMFRAEVFDDQETTTVQC
jgi:hypothetical protein